MDYRFVHASDLHLDTPFDGIGQIDPSVQRRFVDASLRSFDNLVDFTIRSRASFLLLSGDIYDGAVRGIRAQIRFLNGIKRLYAEGIKVFIVHGNHDPLTGWSAIAEWPSNVTVFPADTVGSVTVSDGTDKLAVVHGISYKNSHTYENLARLFQRDDADSFEIGLLHCSIETSSIAESAISNHPAYAPCSLSDLRDSGLDYWALGHIHKLEIISENYPTIIYPGSIQGRGFKQSECGEKGAMLIRVSDTGGKPEVTGYEFVPLSNLRFEIVEINMEEIKDINGLLGSIRESIESIRSNSAYSENIRTSQDIAVRVKLVGRSHMSGLINQDKELLEALRDIYDDVEPIVYVDSVENATSPDIDLETVLARDDFSSVLVRKLYDTVCDKEKLERFWDEYCSKELSTAGLRDAEDFDPETKAELMKEATLYALDLLTRGEG